MTSPSAPLTVAEHAGLSLLARAELVGRESAGPAAAEVDREGRFPHEAVDALRAHKLLNCAVPVDQAGRERPSVSCAPSPASSAGTAPPPR